MGSVVKSFTLNNLGIFSQNVETFPNVDDEFTLPVIVLTGANATGKTTIINAIRACASDMLDPMGLGERSKGMYANFTGTKKSAGATLHYYNGDHATWKVGSGMNRTAPITPPAVSGIVSPIDLKTKQERHEFWDKLLVSKLSWDDIEKHFQHEIRTMRPPYKEKMTKYFEQQYDANSDVRDWDEYAKKCKTQALDYRIKASKGFDAQNVSNKSARTLLNEINKIKISSSVAKDLTTYEAAHKAKMEMLKTPAKVDPLPLIKQTAVAKQESDEAHKTYIDTNTKMSEAANKISGKIVSLTNKLNKLETEVVKARNNLPVDEEVGGELVCPHCHKTSVMLDGRLVKQSTVDKPEVRERLYKAYESANKKYLDLKKQIEELRVESQEKRELIQEAKGLYEDAEKKYKIYKKQSDDAQNVGDSKEYDKDAIEREIEEINNKITECRMLLKQATDIQTARAQLLRSYTFELLEYLCNTKGVRANLRASKINDFNESLANLHKIGQCPFPAPYLDPSELTFNLGDLPIKLASGAEVWMSKALIQLAILLLLDTKQAVIAIDGADILGTSKEVAESFWFLLSEVVKRHDNVSAFIAATDFKDAYRNEALARSNKNIISVLDVSS